MHNTLLVIHRWLALVTALLILLVALTGSALVFEGALDRRANPGLWYVTPAKSTISLDTLVARARSAAPGAPVTGLSFGRVADRAYFATVGTKQVFLDPYTGDVLGSREARDVNDALPRRLHVLHTSLMAGETGGAVVAFVTMATLVLVFTGVLVWWSEKRWRVQWSAPWKRIVFDVHHAFGISASLVLFIIAASGLVIHYEALGAAIGRLGDGPQPVPPMQPTSGGIVTISTDALARAGLAALPGASITFIAMAPKPDQPFVVAMRFPEDRTPGGRSRVHVDRYTGAVLLAESTRLAPVGKRITNVMRSVHTGDVLGKPTEAVWLLAALVLASQAVSGVVMWWNGRASRKRA